MFRAMAIGLTMMCAATAAVAQDYDWRRVLDSAERAEVSFDADYEASRNRQIPFYFTIATPLSPDDLQTQTRFPDEGWIGEARFLMPDDRLLESVQIGSGTLAAETPEEQLESVFVVIDTMIFPTLDTPETTEVLGGRITDINGAPAVEFLALYNDPANGLAAVRIVGVIAPGNRHALYFLQLTMRQRMDLQSPDELALTFAGQMLGSLTFQGARDEAGQMVLVE